MMPPAVADPSAMEAAALPAPGTMVGRYRITELLGPGPIGPEFRAEDTESNASVVLRFLPELMLHAGEEALQGYLTEAKAQSAVEHPGLIRLLRVGRYNNELYVVTQAAEGRSAAEMLAEDGPLHPAAAAHLVAETARALAALHDRRVTHRDIRPENLLQSADGRVRVAGLGIVRVVEELQQFRLGLPLASPHYASPEFNQRGEADGRSDIYSLGATWFHLLTGRTPFLADTSLQVMHKHCVEAPPDPRSLRPEIPEACAALILKAMAKRPMDRPQSAAGFADEVADLLKTLPPAPPRAPASKAARPPSGSAAAARPASRGVPAVGAAPSTGSGANRAVGPRSTSARPASTGAKPVVLPSRSVAAVKTAGNKSGGRPPAAARRAPGGAWAAPLGLVVAVGAGAVALVTARGGSGGDTQAAVRTPPEPRPPDSPPQTVEPPPQTRPPNTPAVPAPTADPVVEQFTLLRQIAEDAVERHDRTQLDGVVAKLDAFGREHAESTTPAHRALAAEAAKLAERHRRVAPARPALKTLVSFAEVREVVGAAFGGPPGTLAFGRPDGRLVMLFLAQTEGSKVRAGVVNAHGPAGLQAFAYSRDNRLLVTIGGEGEVKFWNPVDGKAIGALKAESGPARSVAAAPDGSSAATAGPDGAVRIWEAAERRLRLASEPVPSPAVLVEFSPDGGLLAVAHEDRIVRLRSAADGKLVRELPAHAAAIRSVRFSPDGKTLAVGGGSAELWETDTGRKVRTLPGEGPASFSGDGRFLAVAGPKSRIWRVADGREAASFSDPDNPSSGTLEMAVFSSKSGVVAGYPSGGPLRLWAFDASAADAAADKAGPAAPAAPVPAFRPVPAPKALSSKPAPGSPRDDAPRDDAPQPLPAPKPAPALKALSPAAR